MREGRVPLGFPTLSIAEGRIPRDVYDANVRRLRGGSSG
jgi:hypothetical protein